MYHVPKPQKPARDTFFDTLIPRIPDPLDIELPGDGKNRRIGIAVVLAWSVALVASLAAVVIASCGGQS